VWGLIVVKKGSVTRLGTMGETIDYEYATNASIPLGIPSKITIGKGWFGYQGIFLIEELVYGHQDEPHIAFNPESKYVSPDLPRVNWITNGQRMLLREGYKLSPPPPRQ
jgi:hypothetical protein